jgi:ATP-dependent Clp protease protease subunit
MENNEKSSESQTSISTKLLDYAIEARKIFITGEIDQKMAKEAIQQLHALAHISDDPIYVFVSSPGGHVESGDMIFDAIRFISPKVFTIGSGWVASAGALIYVAADKENRYSLPNTRFLLHQPSGGFQGTPVNVEIYAKEIIRMKERLNKIFSDATGQSLEKIIVDTERDFWLSAEEAIEYGLVNKIIVSEKELNPKQITDHDSKS